MPVVVDAGIGAPPRALEAMELGADAVLVNTAIAVARDPQMARHSSPGAGGRRAGTQRRLGSSQRGAVASSPLTAFSASQRRVQ